MVKNAGGRGIGVILLCLAFTLSLLFPALLSPKTIKAEAPEVYAVIQIPSQEKEDTLKAAVEGVLDTAGAYAIVGCTQTQLEGLVADGYILIDQCAASDECLALLTDELKSRVPSEMAITTPVVNFGYKFIDSNEDRGPCFNWIDIAGTGTNTGIHCDDSCGVVVPIGFSFEFFGDSHRTVGISPNGYLTFGGDLSDWTNDCIPNINDPNDAMFVFWDDLYTDCDGANVYYDTRNINGHQAFIVEWKDARFCCSCDAYRLTFEAILFEGSNDILFQYLDMTGGDRADGHEATIGIENSDATGGLEYSCNSPTISNSLAILFYLPPLPNNFNCTEVQTPPLKVSPSMPGNLTPPQVKLQFLNVNPQQASANQSVTISTNVVNTGDQPSNYNVVLKVNGQVEESRMVSVGPLTSQPVKFMVTRSQPGTYTVDVGVQRGSFVVLGDKKPGGRHVNAGLVAMLVLGVVLVITVVLMISSRRPA
jgi:hypothetical protein